MFALKRRYTELKENPEAPAYFEVYRSLFSPMALKLCHYLDLSTFHLRKLIAETIKPALCAGLNMENSGLEPLTPTMPS